MAGCVLAVAVGIFARELGSGDTSGPNRLAAKNLAGEGLNALLDGDYSLARAKLDAALREDELFAEAYLGRAMTLLAVGDFVGARKDADFAGILFGDGRHEKRAWPGVGSEAAAAEGRLISERIVCLLDEAESAELEGRDSSRLFQIFYALRRAESCDDAQQILGDWARHGAAHRVMTAALTECPTLWPCTP